MLDFQFWWSDFFLFICFEIFEIKIEIVGVWGSSFLILPLWPSSFPYTRPWHVSFLFLFNMFNLIEKICSYI